MVWNNITSLSLDGRAVLNTRLQHPAVRVPRLYSNVFLKTSRLRESQTYLADFSLTLQIIILVLNNQKK